MWDEKKQHYYYASKITLWIDYAYELFFKLKWHLLMMPLEIWFRMDSALQSPDWRWTNQRECLILYQLHHVTYQRKKGKKNLMKKKNFNQRAFFFHDQLQSPRSSLNPNFHSSGPMEWDKSIKFSSNACKPIIWIKHQSSGST